MKDSNNYRFIFIWTVVNCFQKLLSSWWRTANFVNLDNNSKLWIAFKNYYLRDEGQRRAEEAQLYFSCELLSKIIIFVMKDSSQAFTWVALSVVNCFQKLLSSWWRTAKPKYWRMVVKLWIAFKNYYLRDEGQLSITNIIIFHSCELLSKIIIFVMKDNSRSPARTGLFVVNCFQKLLSSWWRTTAALNIINHLPLWIAFKNYYLRDEGQQWCGTSVVVSCCELLSKIIIFVMKDNWRNASCCVHLVVNCFQKLLSSWWRTTKAGLITQEQ